MYAWGPWLQGQVAVAESALERAIACARLAGDERTEAQALNLYVGAAFFGPAPVVQAIRRCDDLFARSSGQRVVASASRALAGVRAMQGDLVAARGLAQRSRAILDDLGLPVTAAGATEVHGLVELLAGDPVAAERALRAGYEILDEIGETNMLSNLAAMLADALNRQGRHEEALRFSEVAERAAAPDDLVAQVLWRARRAKALAARGLEAEAEPLAYEAVALAEPMPDFLVLSADALLALAEVLRLRGRPAEAVAASRRALRLYEQKGNIVAAGWARAAGEVDELDRFPRAPATASPLR